MLDGHRRLLRSRFKCKECTEPRGRGRAGRLGRVKAAGVLWVEHMGGPMARRFELIFSPFPSRFFRTDHEMDRAAGRGDEEAVEIFAQLFDLITPRYAVHFQK